MHSGPTFAFHFKRLPIKKKGRHPVRGRSNRVTRSLYVNKAATVAARTNRPTTSTSIPLRTQEAIRTKHSPVRSSRTSHDPVMVPRPFGRRAHLAFEATGKSSWCRSNLNTLRRSRRERMGERQPTTIPKKAPLQKYQRR